MNRQEVYQYIKQQYGVEPEYPWARTPRSAVLRHKNNRKWFAAIVDITEDKLGLASNNPIDALLLKCDPLLKSSFIDRKSIFPAYHMNKEHWITIILDKRSQKETVCRLIDHSHELTKKIANPNQTCYI